ncbi:Phosphoribosyl-AMP cyclohydrolase [hydrothermal vent metagenome]|uniref:Histidine biosynthesis bifunctional protein HisIE n=1 Tax=hydrothermal vent metagenome TaxID=652676 RepID=A0A3B1A7D4_9ZZZZ
MIEESDTDWLDTVKWNDDGLAPVITQEISTGKVLTLAWMNRESLRKTRELGQAVYWSRSRQKLWQKGEQSGHVQRIKEIRLDCDCDALLLSVEQVGGIACHTGRHACFFYGLKQEGWVAQEPVLKSPEEIYKS